ncbi:MULTISPECIES: pseudouridine synthase [unclassified Lacticaseibacillus]|uniref:pseudouridine synthase n=1 Tax=unclassified Lacticaseibacillus TaxID=2759744 RepID=UPI001941272A|nr:MULTISPECIES: pseudouridine synthase [unclassified Lacticaseibacillus]
MPSKTNEERLQKAIANAGVASRRHAEELIAGGHVTVNGEVVTQMGVKVTSQDAIEVDGVPLNQEEQKQYFVFYKPRDVISAVTDDKGRRTVTDFFEDVKERIYPVGRLDWDASGLLIMTNDGDFANMLMHPSYKVEKKYVVKVQGIPTRDKLMPLKDGLVVDHKKLAPARFKQISSDKLKNTAIIQLTIHQGINHQVKKMFKAIGYPVMKLAREQYGPLTLEGLQPGEYRPLKREEIHALEALAQKG